MRRALLPAGAALALALVAALALSRGGAGRKLVVFHAGSLSVPFRDLAALFMEKNPDVTVLAEAAGSRECARKISDLGRRCDVFGSADYKVVENLLSPEHVAFHILFATNEMAIAYTERSRAAGRLKAGNWHEVLLEKDVAFGRADPERDPCGYRTLMVFQLAERHCGVPGLARRLEAKHGQTYIRPKETDLLALLEAGEIDCLFIYRSVAQQHGLKFLRLPPEVNLGAQEHAALYATATVELTGRTPGERITRRGAPMVYSVTIPRNAPSPGLAAEFVALLLSAEGQALMERHGQAALRPPRALGPEAPPERLRPLCAEGKP